MILSYTRRHFPLLYSFKVYRLSSDVHIWDADVLIWAASQIVEARDRGARPSRLIAATPYEILTFIGRRISGENYQRLKAALDRLQSTTVATTLRQSERRRMHRFSWINEWREVTDASGRAVGLQLILPDWFFTAVLDHALILTIDVQYFALTGGLERWLYRLARKHGGRQSSGWVFELRHLYAKSGSLPRFSDFAIDIRRIAKRQSLPGYRLQIRRLVSGADALTFVPNEGGPLNISARLDELAYAVDNL